MVNMFRMISRDQSVIITYNQTQQIIEGRNGLGNNPSNDPADESNCEPAAQGHPVSLAHSISVSEDSNIDVFQADMPIHDTRTENLRRLASPGCTSACQTHSWNGNAIGHLLQHRTSRAERR